MKDNIGTYVGVRYAADSRQRIRNLTNKLNVPNVVARDKLHSTILYSRVIIDVPYGEKQTDYLAWTRGLEIWKDNGKNILVLKIGSSEMSMRHEELLKFGGTSDFPNFNQHITLSYDVGYWKIPTRIWGGFNLYTEVEYTEELILDWK